jgi:hypothetical protein
MALRGDYLTVRVQQHSSGTTNEVIAESTSVSVDFSAEALETTSQTSGLNASYIGGKVNCVISGDYLLASDGEQFTRLFAHMNAGDVIEIDVYRSATKFLSGEGVFTSLNLSGGDSGVLVTGSYSIQCSGDMASA